MSSQNPPPDDDATRSGEQQTMPYSADGPSPSAGRQTETSPIPAGPPQVPDDGSPMGPGSVIFENYEIKKLLASGGMGEVYLATHTELGTQHAVKVIKPQLLGNDMIRPLTRREAMLLSQINNDAVVAYHGFLRDTRGNYYLIMEFVEGPSLKQAMASGKTLSDEDYYTLRARLIQGLMVLHQSGVVHRDLSPDNVILQDDEISRAKLIDLGIAKIIKPDVENTIIGESFAGKLRYASPEQLGMFGKEVGPRSDMYSLGLVLVAALLGKPLEMGKNPISACAARMELPNLQGIPKNLLPELTALLQPDPDMRPADLESFVRDWPDPYAPTPGPSRWRWVAAVLAVVVLAGGVGYFYLDFDPNKLPPGELAAYFQQALNEANVREADGHFEILRSQYPEYPELPAMAERLDNLRANAAATQVSQVQTALKNMDLQAADQALEELHAIAPGHQSLATLRAEIQQRRNETNLEQRLETLLSTPEVDADALLEGRNTLQALAKLDTDHPRLEPLREQLEARIDERLQAQLQAAQQARQNHDPAGIETALAVIARFLPAEHPQLVELRQQRDLLKQQLTQLQHLSSALDEGDLQSARQWWNSLQATGADHPDLANLQTRFQDAVTGRVEQLGPEVRQALDDYRLEEARERLADITRLDLWNRHQDTRQTLLQRLDQSQSIVSEANNVAAAIDAGEIHDALRRWERLRDMDPEYPQLEQLQQRLAPLLDDTLETLLNSTDLAQADELMPILEDFLGDDPRLADIRQRLALSNALTACRDGLDSQGEDSRVGLHSAVECFQDVLRRFPGNQAATRAMDDLAERQAALVERLWQQSDARQAEAALNDLLGFASRYPQLDALLAQLPGIGFSDPLADGDPGPVMVVIPPGEVLLSAAGQSQISALQRPFAVSRFEITRGEFKHFVDAQGGYLTHAEEYNANGYGCVYYNPQGEEVSTDVQSNWENPRFLQDASHPVVCLTMRDILDFTGWLSTQTGRHYRLPTDAEWEYLVRAGDNDPAFWQQRLSSEVCEISNLRQSDAADSCRDGRVYTTDTGRFAANPFGVYDLIGNAAEWTCSVDSNDMNALSRCLDRDSMRQSFRDGAPAKLLTRGGSWYNSPEKLIAGDHRIPILIYYPLNQIGFRVVRELDTDTPIASATANQ